MWPSSVSASRSLGGLQSYWGLGLGLVSDGLAKASASELRISVLVSVSDSWASYFSLLFAVQHNAADVKLSKMLNGCNCFSIRCSLYAEEGDRIHPNGGLLTRDGKEPEPSNHEPSQNPGFAIS